MTTSLEEPLRRAVHAVVHGTQRAFVSWKREQIIRGRGTAVPLRLIDDDGEVLKVALGGWTQEFEAVELRLRAVDVRMSATYALKHNGEVRVHGQLSGSGVLIGGRAYLSYRIHDSVRGQGMYGVLKLLCLSGATSLASYLAQSYAKAAGTVLGRVSLTRVGTDR